MASLHILALNRRCLLHPQSGGCEINLFEQARCWARDGHRVTVFCADPGRAAAPERCETVDGIEIIRRGGRFSVYVWAMLHMLRFGSRYDRILDITNGISFFAPIFSAVPSVLLVHHVHGH